MPHDSLYPTGIMHHGPVALLLNPAWAQRDFLMIGVLR